MGRRSGALEDMVRTVWENRRVYLTGHTGFKGSWMSLWLASLGATVHGYALAPERDPNVFTDARVAGSVEHEVGDIRNLAEMERSIAAFKPEVVFHMAAQPLVRRSYLNPIETYSTNVMGTAHVLDAIRRVPSVRAVVIITTDKCYENREWFWGYREEDRLGGFDPYSNSKACAELVTMSFRDSFFKDGPPIASARAGNVIGGGDWSADRLIPDCVRALATDSAVTLRYPEAIRPWQHVLEPLSGYLALARALVLEPATAPRAVNFGPDPASFCTVREVVDAFSARFEGRPGWIRDSTAHAVEARALTLSSARAEQSLGWRPKLDIAESLSWTADWYRAFAEGENMLAFSEAQLAQYEVR